MEGSVREIRVRLSRMAVVLPDYKESHTKPIVMLDEKWMDYAPLSYRSQNNNSDEDENEDMVFHVPPQPLDEAPLALPVSTIPPVPQAPTITEHLQLKQIPKIS